MKKVIKTERMREGKDQRNERSFVYTI